MKRRESRLFGLLHVFVTLIVFMLVPLVQAATGLNVGNDIQFRDLINSTPQEKPLCFNNITGVLGTCSTVNAGGGYISVPASALRPNTGNVDYSNRGYDLNLDTGFGTFTAPLRLPHGATVISMTIHFDDADGGDSGFGGILRTEFNTPQQMVYILFADASGSLSDTSIDYAVIDNSQYSYYLSVYLHDPSITLYEVLIEYTTR